MGDHLKCPKCHEETPVAGLLMDFEKRCWGCGYYFSEGQINSALDPNGAYGHDGECIGRIPCECEDYPCCGH